MPETYSCSFGSVSEYYPIDPSAGTWAPRARDFPKARRRRLRCLPSGSDKYWFELEEEALIVSASKRPVLYEFLLFRGNTDMTSETESLLSSLESSQIRIQDRNGIRDYLSRYSGIRDLLPSVCESALRHVPNNSQLSLEVYRDPEIDDEYLTLYIRQRDYDKRIMDIIEEISADYVGQLADVSGWLLVTTDFAPPRQ